MPRESVQTVSVCGSCGIPTAAQQLFTSLELELIEEVAEYRHGHTPRRFSIKDIATIEAVLPKLLAVEKGYFKPTLTSRDPSALMARIHRERGRPDHFLKTGMRKRSHLR